MKQVLHILAKDARHLWAEILLSLAITAAFAMACPADWRTAAGINYPSSGFGVAAGEARVLVSILELLVPVSWWLLVANLIHDERLVGDRQFWLTRPYEWKKLLAAKLLFLVIFLYLPLFIAQCTLLAVAGFSPFSHIAGMLFNLLLISGLIVLPLVAVATVTSNFARMTLVLLGILLSIGALSALALRINLESMKLPWEMGAFFALLVCLCAAAVVSQYATRNIRASVLLLVAFPVLYLSIGEFLVPSQILVNRSYPLSSTSSDAPVQFSYSPSEFKNPAAMAGRLPREVNIQIPIEFSGIADRSVIMPDAVRATVEAPGGFHWDSRWQLIHVTKLTPADKTAYGGVDMPLAVYDRIKSLPLTVHLTLALTEASEGMVTSVSLPEGSFSVPDFGVCSLQAAPNDPGQMIGVSCLSALRDPPLTQIQMVGHNTCDAAQADAGVPSSIWQGSLDAWPAQFGISSVKFPYVAWAVVNNPPRQVNAILNLCRGTPITFTRYDLSRRVQVAITMQGFQLPKLTQGERNVITNP